jgi:nucleoside-triphosphatase THEP1
MVSIVTGEINSGKTKKMLSIFQQTYRGDGFISEKRFNRHGHLVGYDLVRLSGDDRLPFIHLKKETPDDWVEAFQYLKFSFSLAGINYANALIDSLIDNNVNPIYIDEIGPLELQGKGFDPLLRKVLRGNTDVYISVRDTCVNDVINTYQIQPHILIHTRQYRVSQRKILSK